MCFEIEVLYYHCCMFLVLGRPWETSVKTSAIKPPQFSLPCEVLHSWPRSSGRRIYKVCKRRFVSCENRIVSFKLLMRYDGSTTLELLLQCVLYSAVTSLSQITVSGYLLTVTKSTKTAHNTLHLSSFYWIITTVKWWLGRHRSRRCVRRTQRKVARVS